MLFRKINLAVPMIVGMLLLVDMSRVNANDQATSLAAGSLAGTEQGIASTEQNDAAYEHGVAIDKKNQISAAKIAYNTRMIADGVPLETRMANLAIVDNYENEGDQLIEDFFEDNTLAASDYNEADNDYMFRAEGSWFDYHGRSIWEWAIEEAEDAIEGFQNATVHWSDAKAHAISAQNKYDAAICECYS